MKYFSLSLVAAYLALTPSQAVLADQKVPDWGNASSYSLVGVSIDNKGATLISGNTGSAYTATGFGIGLGTVINGALNSAVDSKNRKTISYQAAIDVAVATNTLANDIWSTAYYPTSTDLSGLNLGTTANNLKPGIYTFSGDASLSGTLTLDDGGDKNALYIFRIAGSFSTADASVIHMKSGGSGINIFWTAARNTTLGSGSFLEGNIVGQTDNGLSYGSNIILNKGASVSGRVFTDSGTISLNTNTVDLLIDSDGDGVGDDQDDYPNDSSRAFDQLSTQSTIVFEDQWPSSGDFDMNDVVMKFCYDIVTNASNNLVQVIGKYILVATGGSQANAFGVEFPMAASSVGTVNSGIKEAGQANAVFILYSSMRKEMVNWNTIPGKPVSPPNLYAINFMVKDTISLSDFKLDAYNPFIYNTVNNKREEIHLTGRQPTSLADHSLFGKGVDVSVPGTTTTYLSKSGMPWAIILPMSDFDYPVETKAINKGFTHFLDWAVYGGGIFPDWFTNDAAKTSDQGGYRSPSFIYATYSQK